MLYLCLLSMVFQSCYSYKTIDNSKIIAGKKYKVKKGADFKIIRIVAISDSTIKFRAVHKQIIEMPIKDIKSIKKRKFSPLKTLVLVTTIVPTLFFIGFQGFNTTGKLNLGK